MKAPGSSLGVRTGHGQDPIGNYVTPPGRLTGDTISRMESVTVRELRNHGGEVLDRVARGEALVVTRDGAEVAELRPRTRRSASSADLIARRRHLPTVDTGTFRRDLDALLDAEL